MQLATLAVFPVFLMWAHGRQMFPRSIRKLFDLGGIVLYLVFIVTFCYVATLAAVKADTGIASRLALLLEMARFLMKTHAFIRSSAPSALASNKKANSEDKPEIKTLPTFDSYLYFLFAPTLLYRDSYPRTKCIRWSFVFKCYMEVLGCIFYTSFIFERFVIPVFYEFGAANINSSAFVLQIFGSMMPAMLIWFGGFYLLQHSWLNASAEMLRFADRLFYLVSPTQDLMQLNLNIKF